MEFLAAAGALVALYAGITIVGRLQDLQWATIAASRYAAFEHAIHGRRVSAATLEGQLRVRFYEPPAAPLRTHDVRTDRDPWQRSVARWTDRSPSARLLVSRPADVTLAVRESEPPGASARLAAAVAALADGAARATGGNFDVERRGNHAATVHVRLAPFAAEPAPLSNLTLALSERTTVFGDSWNASGPAHVADRTRAFVPAGALAALRPLLDGFRWALRLFEPALDALCLGRIDPELVPADRLGAPGSGERGSWVAPC